MPFIRIPGLINALVVQNIRQQRELERNQHVSTVLSPEGGLLHRLLTARLWREMFCSERELPAVTHASSPALADFEPDELPIAGRELYKMASYVAGSDRGDDIESVVQCWLARRFNPRYESTPSVCAAARLLGSWHRRGRMSAFVCLASGRLGAAQALLSSSVAPDLHAAYAPSLLLPYIVKCLERMRKLARDPMIGARLSPELVVAGCLAAPRVTFRCCTKPVKLSFLARPLPAHTLVILPARRLRATGDGSSAFGGDDGGLYPALRLIRRLLTQVWTQSRDVYHPAARSTLELQLDAALLASRVEERQHKPKTTLIFQLSRRLEVNRRETSRRAGASARRDASEHALAPATLRAVAPAAEQIAPSPR
jgi:hypothetical protein